LQAIATMSSRYGPQVSGSDGSDFFHREKVASHYQVSAVNKWRLKFTLVLHLLLYLLMVMRMSVSLCVLAGVRPPALLQKLRLPKAELWEYAWLASLLPMILGFISMPRNKSFLIKQFILGFFIFGLAPVCYAIYLMIDDLFEYYHTHESKDLFLGYPRVVIWSMFLVIALQVHVFGISFGWQLSKAWSKTERRKKAT